MADFINTIDALGDDAVIDSIILRTITEFKDNLLTGVGPNVFASCKALASIDIPMVTSIGSHAFDSCTSLKQAVFPLATETVGGAFYYCSALETIELPMLAHCANTDFLGCSSLTEITLPLITDLAPSIFMDCHRLVKADFPSLKMMRDTTFSQCYSLKAVILRNTVMVNTVASKMFTNCSHILGTVHATYNPEGLADGYIYVPRALVDSYKTATNWSVYATQFRALEDYTVDGTITGEIIVYPVQNNLYGVVTSDKTTSAVRVYYAELTPKYGDSLDEVIVTMGGVDVTESVYSDGVINIENVTGDIVVTATAVHPVFTELPNTPVTLTESLNTGLIFGSTSANGVANDWTMVMEITNPTNGAIIHDSNGSWGDVFGVRWHFGALTAHICKGPLASLNPSDTAKIRMVITHTAGVANAMEAYYLKDGEIVKQDGVPYYGSLLGPYNFYDVYLGTCCTFNDFKIYWGKLNDKQIAEYLNG